MVSETSPPLKVTASDVMRSTPARRVLLASLAFYMGLMLQAATLGKHIFDITGREIDIGWLGLAEFAPVALFVLLSGSVADRFNRKVVSAVALGGELVCTTALTVYALSEPTAVWPFFLIAFLFGTSRAFLSPAIRSIYPMVAPPGGLPQVIAISSAVFTGAMIVGPALAGLLYSIHPAMSYGATSAFILVGIVGILRVSLPKVEQPQVTERPSVRTAMEGLFFIRRTPVLLAAISLDLFAVLFGGAVALLPAIAEKQLGVGDVAYGWLRAAVGIGSAGTAAFLAIAPLRRHVGKWLLLSVGLFGLGTIVLGWTNSYLVAFAMVVLISGADMVSVFIRSSITPLVTPDSKRGRVSAVENVFIGATNELGAFKQGALSQGIGLPATVISGGILTLGVVGVWWKKFPTLRDIDQFSDLDTPENPTA